MHQSHGALDPFVVEVGVKSGQLRRRQHSLVDQCPAGQAGEVDAGVHFRSAAHGLVDLVTGVAEKGLVLNTLADDVGPALEIHAAEPVAADKDLAKGRHRFDRRAAESARIDRDIAPTREPRVLRP